MPAAATEIPVKPNRAAIKAITKNARAQRNMRKPPVVNLGTPNSGIGLWKAATFLAARPRFCSVFTKIGHFGSIRRKP